MPSAVEVGLVIFPAGFEVTGDEEALAAEPGEIVEGVEAIAFAAVGVAVPHEVIVAVPVGDSGPSIQRGCGAGLVQAFGPIIGGNGRNGGDPLLVGAREAKSRRMKIGADGEEEVVSGKIHVGAANGGPELGEGGIDVEVALGEPRAEQVEAFELAGIIEKKIGGVGEGAERIEVGAVSVNDQTLLVGESEFGGGGVPKFFLWRAGVAGFGRLEFVGRKMFGDPDFPAEGAQAHDPVHDGAGVAGGAAGATGEDGADDSFHVDEVGRRGCLAGGTLATVSFAGESKAGRLSFFSPGGGVRLL